MITFSIIIPFYNAEKYIENTLESVIAQSPCFDEIICVDNNSTDRTKEMIKKFQKNTTNITYIFEEKQGVSAARNTGLAHVKTDYVLFLDSDDLLLPAFFSQMKAVVEKDTSADIFQYNFNQSYANGTTVQNRYMLSPGIYSGQAYLEQMLKQFTYETKHMVWSYVYKTTFLTEHQLRFDVETAMFEDIIFLHKLFALNPKIRVSDITGVSYQYSESSSTVSTADEQYIVAIAHMCASLHPMTLRQQQYIEQLSSKVLTRDGYQAISNNVTQFSFSKKYVSHKAKYLLMRIINKMKSR